MPVESVLRIDDKPANAQIRIILDGTGVDLGRLLEQTLNSALERGREVIYLDVSLADPAVDAAVEIARNNGFFFGALLVDRLGCDRLRLQCYDPAVAAPNSMVVATEQGQALLDYIVEDQAAVSPLRNNPSTAIE